MDARDLKVYFLILILFFAGCDHPARKLNSFKPESFEYVFTKGGVKFLENDSLDSLDDSLSENSDFTYKVNKTSNKYKTILSFLNKHKSPTSVFDKVSIPQRHILLLRIKFKDKMKKNVRLSLGRNWVVYYGYDFFGESSATIYPATKEDILRFLLVLGEEIGPSGK